MWTESRLYRIQYLLLRAALYIHIFGLLASVSGMHRSFIGYLRCKWLPHPFIRLAEYISQSVACDFVLNNFEVRQSARDEEVEALRQAKATLSGAKFEEFLQTM